MCVQAMELCSGRLDGDCEQKGGEGRWHGKPSPEDNRSCFALIEGSVPARIAAIGDSLRTDVAGAQASGIASIFIAGGIHGEELHVDKQGRADQEAYQAFMAAAQGKPTVALPSIRWRASSRAAARGTWHPGRAAQQARAWVGKEG